MAETRTVDRSSERQHIIDAAYRCLDRNAGSAVSITEILDEAGLGTRAFYRNFSTKHDLLLELFRRDRDAVRAQLREVVARAEGPVEALRAWMAHMLDLVSNPRKRKRMATFYSEEMRRTPGYDRELEIMSAADQASIAAILHRGKAEGIFTECAPESDARTIRAAVEAALLDRFQQKTTGSVADEVDHLMGFVLRGLGAAGMEGAPDDR
ncbi:TetR/AcrR family transcriptional regulator [Mycolicibacterium phlei]|uniref:TetR/AcrR family transcriptional regulator n=1 Tax=Mycolicibacterium phlei TaxID=1771 RepID=UPI00025AE019|nr:TetR/AcrR family transcriptional regulator [Mycolicibacterium phlei]EID17460.1 TetR family transcriptional regulator [Mycolicibacterium phlei RIVM601174]MBF4191082.1 TetR family transcriptional regulator [Mycolicibacterium phlei]